MSRPNNHTEAREWNRRGADLKASVAEGIRRAGSVDPFEDAFAENARSVRGRSKFVAGSQDDVAFANSRGRSARTT